MPNVAPFSLSSTPTTFQTSTYQSAHIPSPYLLPMPASIISTTWYSAQASVSTLATISFLTISESISPITTPTLSYNMKENSQTTNTGATVYTSSLTTNCSPPFTPLTDNCSWQHSTESKDKRGNTPETTSQTALRQAIEAAIRVVMSQTYYQCAVGKTLSGCELFGGGIVCGWVWEEPAPSPAPSQGDGALEEGSVFWNEPAIEVDGGDCEECGGT